MTKRNISGSYDISAAQFCEKLKHIADIIILSQDSIPDRQSWARNSMPARL